MIERWINRLIFRYMKRKMFPDSAPGDEIRIVLKTRTVDEQPPAATPPPARFENDMTRLGKMIGWMREPPRRNFLHDFGGGKTEWEKILKE